MLKVEIRELDGTRRELKVEVPVERVDEELHKAYLKYRQTLQIPGFRKGRIPLNMFRSRFGKSIKAEVLNELLPKLYEEAKEAEGIEVIAFEEIDDVDYEEGDHFRFTARVDVRPEIRIERYEHLKVEKPIYPVAEEDVERRLESLREQYAIEHTVDRPAQRGDFLIVDIQRLDRSGVPLVGQKSENQSLRIGGEGSPSDEFEEQLVGIRAGEERHIRFTYREDWSDQRIAGREEALAISVKEIKEREVPELDDEFARDTGAYKTVDELKNAIQESVSQEAEFLSRKALEANIIEQVARENPFDPPEVVVENALNARLEREKSNSEKPIDEALFRENNRPDAIRQVRDYLILDEIARREDIEVTSEEVDTRIAQQAQMMGRPFRNVKEEMVKEERIDEVRQALLHEKALSLLIEKAQVVEMEIPRDEGARIVQV